MQKSEIIADLISLNLDHDEAKIYYTLKLFGEQTVIEVGENSGLDRGRIYRRIPHLKEKKVIEQIVGKRGMVLRAAPVENIKRLLDEKKHTYEQLLKDLDSLSQTASAGVLEDAQTKVAFYEGKEGIKQMVWNVLSAKDEAIGYSYRTLWNYLGEKFMNDWTAEFSKRNLIFRDLYSDRYVKSLMLDRDTEMYNPNEFTGRYLPSEVVDITVQMDIYNDTLAIYSWHEDEVFGVEIHNNKIANMQRQIFEALWQQAGEKRRR